MIYTEENEKEEILFMQNNTSITYSLLQKEITVTVKCNCTYEVETELSCMKSYTRLGVCNMNTIL